jgi:hypothetical protein
VLSAAEGFLAALERGPDQTGFARAQGDAQSFPLRAAFRDAPQRVQQRRARVRRQVVLGTLILSVTSSASERAVAAAGAGTRGNSPGTCVV